MVFVHLSDEEKLQVVLVGLALFVAALLAALCLAGSCCPLNRWLLERSAKRRRQLLEQTVRPPAYVFSGGAQLGGAKGAPSGPPPAYEAALRVTRLQSLTGTLPPLAKCNWLETDKTQPLDFGDYFHQPREPVLENGVGLSPCAAPADRPAPVKLRLWVRLVEPGELVSRVRGQARSGEQTSSTDKSPLSRQLSIPHLFGSLVALGRHRSQSQETLPEPPPTPKESHETHFLTPDSLLSSTDSSSGAGSLPPNLERPQPEKEPPPPSSPQEQRQQQPEASKSRHAHSPLLAGSPVTSRVLHMNVASFSYLKDESLVSTKRHNQMNFHHFHSKSNEPLSSKMCQLVISICDVENLLGFSRLSERSCALLAASSAIYIQCEILAAKSKTGRLLSYPLRALQNQPSQQSSHTLDFCSSISAAALERHTVISLPPPAGAPSVSCEPNQTPTEDSPRTLDRAAGVWRHEPSADGKSIVQFSSVPKQVAQQEQLAAASLPPDAQTAPDLIQFDSVFVSPILSKSTVAEGHLRLRVYSQCRYVNESCLAELKLPLKRLLSAESHDNLADAAPDARRPLEQQQRQADFILNNLLSNLITAASGEPLAALIEQISREATESNASVEQSGGARSSSFRLPSGLWRERELLRATNSFGGSICRLASLGLSQQQQQQTPASGQVELERQQQERERRLEQNYCRSLMVSHWLNYLVAPSYLCQPVEEPRGELILGLSYLPTSNRVVFNAHRASIANGLSKQAVKSLRLQTSTCYLVRLLMVLNGRVLRRKQTPVSRKAEWDSQDPITFDLVSVGAEQPSFVVALVTRNAAPNSTSSSLQNLQRSGQSELEPNCATYRMEAAEAARPSRDLVIGHLVLAEQIWRELRAKPRKQIVRQFKLY